MASHVEVQVAPATARDGSDTRNKDLDGAHTDKWELACCEDCGENVAECAFVGMDNTVYRLCPECNDFATRAMHDRWEMEAQVVADAYERDFVDPGEQDDDFLAEEEEEEEDEVEDEWENDDIRW
jgi:ribosome-binding protein aMBF1 (putative translation factor)